MSMWVYKSLIAEEACLASTMAAASDPWLLEGLSCFVKLPSHPLPICLGTFTVSVKGWADSSIG